MNLSLKNALLCAAVVITGALYNGCSDSDNSTTPQPTGPTYSTLLPLKTGNYWIYSRQLVDSATGNATGAIFTDSAFVMDSISYLGRSSYRVVYVQLDSARRDTSYFSKGSDGSIATFFDLNVPQLTEIAPTFPATRLWVTIKPADNYTAVSWTSYDTTIAQLVVSFGGSNLTLSNVKCKITGTKGSTVPVTIGSQSANATEYITNFTVDAGFVTFSLPQRFWFIDKVGIYKSRTDNSAALVAGSPQLRKNGTQSTLIRYSAE
ncbi:MAG: hypothetical protein ACK5JL_06470 [Candidatus Kapaibacterium sp.]|jgi:hypothetical protein